MEPGLPSQLGQENSLLSIDPHFLNRESEAHRIQSHFPEITLSWEAKSGQL